MVKWGRIATGEGSDNGHTDCALCDLFSEECNEGRGCPIVCEGGYDNCGTCNGENSPYNDWIESHDNKAGHPYRACNKQQRERAWAMHDHLVYLYIIGGGRV